MRQRFPFVHRAAHSPSGHPAARLAARRSRGWRVIRVWQETCQQTPELAGVIGPMIDSTRWRCFAPQERQPIATGGSRRKPWVDARRSTIPSHGPVGVLKLGRCPRPSVALHGSTQRCVAEAGRTEPITSSDASGSLESPHLRPSLPSGLRARGLGALVLQRGVYDCMRRFWRPRFHHNLFLCSQLRGCAPRGAPLRMECFGRIRTSTPLPSNVPIG
jgi:hypothetical protein